MQAKVWTRASHAKSRMTYIRNRASGYYRARIAGNPYAQDQVSVADSIVLVKFRRTWFLTGEVQT